LGIRKLGYGFLLWIILCGGNSIPLLITINREDMAWVYLILAGICEIGWAFGLKYSEGFTKIGVSIVTVVVMILSFVLLAQAMKTLPLGTAYGIWTGIGAAGTAILGIVFLNEPRDLIRILCILMIVAGVVGLKVFSGEVK
jgi:quaternary ammonium compound-resistance protein SugE